MEPSQTYLDPPTLAKIQDLELQARSIVEGMVSGSHKSPYQGVSVEFAEHREYVPGDDIRHIDWKVFAKTERFYLKRYEQETNLVCNLVLDVSESMQYGSGGASKLLYASRMAAALAHLVLSQQDSIGLALFEDQLEHLIHPSSQPSHLKHILHLLATSGTGKQPSRIGAVLDELAGRFRKRSLVLVFSDCFDDVASILVGLKHLRHKRHEVVLFQVLDAEEIDFDFRDSTLFRGLEQLPQVLAEPRAFRKAYQEVFGKFLVELKSACRSAGCDYQLFRTDQPLDMTLANYLAGRLLKRR